MLAPLAPVSHLPKPCSWLWVGGHLRSMFLTSEVPCCSQSTWQIRISRQHLASSDLTTLWPGKREKKDLRILAWGCFHFPFPCLCCMTTQPAMHPLDSPWTPCGALGDVSAGHKSQPTTLSASGAAPCRSGGYPLPMLGCCALSQP